MKNISSIKLNKYDVVEITWLDSHSRSGWTNPSGVDRWIKEAEETMTIKTMGYFIHEDKNFIRICQSHDFQRRNEDREGDNIDGLFAIAKPCILDIVKK